MPVFRIVRNSDNRTIYAYSSDAEESFVEYPPELFRHVLEVNVNQDGTINADGREISRVGFLKRFTQGERVTIRAVAKDNAVLDDFMALMDATDPINLDDPDTIAGMNLLEQAGLLAPGRAAEILA